MSTDFAQRVSAEHAQVAQSLLSSVVAADQRQQALQQAIATGLPRLRDDAWRYADVRSIDTAWKTPVDAASAPNAALPERLEGVARFVFIDGLFSQPHSDNLRGLNGFTLGTATHSTPTPALVPERGEHERFGWLNDAFAADVARIAVHSKASVELLFLSQGRDAIHPRVEVLLAANAELHLVERHLGNNAFVNAAVQIAAGQDSRCQHVRVQACGADAVFVDTLQASLARNSEYRLALVHLGAQAARSSLRIALTGRGAQFHLHGASIADAKRTLDTSIHVEHVGPDTTSDQLLRALAGGRSSISFASVVQVAAAAHAASSQQSLKGLIGDTGAEVNLRPQLEILTDQVRASHGATTGAIDENMLFYLLSRGLSQGTARSLLEWAFIEDAVCQISHAALRRQIELMIVDKLGNQAAREALL
jgi:Fe-S cluster assembly protein SufD